MWHSGLWCGDRSLLLPFEMCCCLSTTLGDCSYETINRPVCFHFRKVRSCEGYTETVGVGAQGPCQVCDTWVWLIQVFNIGSCGDVLGHYLHRITR